MRVSRFQVLRCTVALALCLAVAETNSAWTSDETRTRRVHAEGWALGFGSKATEEAVISGRRDAVATAIQNLVPNQRQFHLASVFQGGEKYVLSHRVTRALTQSGRTGVELEVVIDDRTLRRDLARVLARQIRPAPKALLLAAARIGPQKPWSESMAQPAAVKVIDALQSYGVAVVRRDGFPETIELPAAGQPFDRILSERFRRSLKDNDFDIIILAASECQFNAPETLSNLIRNHAETTLKALRVTDGKTLIEVTHAAKVRSTEPRQGLEQAIEDSALKSVEELFVAAILGVANRPESSALTLEFANPGTRDEFELILTLLREMVQPSDIDVIEFNADFARLTTDYDGPIKPVAEALLDAHFDGFRVRPRLVAGRELTFAVVRN